MALSTQKKAWLHHAGGVGRLIEIRGPKRHQFPEDVMLLEAARPIVVRDKVPIDYVPFEGFTSRRHSSYASIHRLTQFQGGKSSDSRRS